MTPDPERDTNKGPASGSLLSISRFPLSGPTPGGVNATTTFRLAPDSRLKEPVSVANEGVSELTWTSRRLVPTFDTTMESDRDVPRGTDPKASSVPDRPMLGTPLTSMCAETGTTGLSGSLLVIRIEAS